MGRGGGGNGFLLAKPMGRFVSRLDRETTGSPAPRPARLDVASANGGPLKKRRQPPLLGAGSPKKFWHTGKADRRWMAGNEGFI